MFTSFNYSEAVGPDENQRKKNSKKTEATSVDWNDGRPHRADSVDGVPLVYSIPKFMNSVLQVCA